MSASATARPAAFLDRDGTIIRDAHYIARVDDVVLLPGAARAIKRLNARDIPVIVVTNQSGIARGLVSESQYAAVRQRVDQLLRAEGARVDASYMCPHHPEFGARETCECRKPGALLFRRAAEEHGLDPARSWFIGDKLRDILPARTLGGTGILVPSEATPAAEIETARAEFLVAASLDVAVDRVIESAP